MKKLILVLALLFTFRTAQAANLTIAQGNGINFTRNSETNTLTIGVMNNTTCQWTKFYSGGVLSGKQSEIDFKPGTGVSFVLNNDTTLGRFNVTINVPLADGNATNLSSGLIPAARIGGGTANSTTYLLGNQTWVPVAISIATAVAGSTYVESYANTTRSTNSLTPVKVKEFSPLTRSGAYNIYFALNSTSVDYVASARIYKNGIAVGGLRNQTGTVVYQAFNEDISGLSNGDVLSIYANTTGGPGESANVKDVQLRCTNPILMQEVSGY